MFALLLAHLSPLVSCRVIVKSTKITRFAFGHVKVILAFQIQIDTQSVQKRLNDIILINGEVRSLALYLSEIQIKVPCYSVNTLLLKCS